MTRIRVPLGKFIKEYSERNKGNEDIPVYSVTNSQGFCTEYFGKEVASQDKTTYKIVPQGYFAYNPSRINVGSVDWQRYEKRVIVSPLYNVFSVSEGIDRQYLYYFLRSDLGRQMIKAKASGSVRDNLKLDMLKEMTIPDISVEQQKFCSSVLDKLHKLIQMRQQELQKLDEFIKARFVELFGDPVSNSYGLPEATLPDLGEFGRGVSKHRPRNDIKLLGGKYPLIQTGDVANAGLYITSYSSTYSELGLKQSKMWDKGTLCITIAANIAKTAILEFDACFPDSVVGFIANERTNNIFVHYWFSFFQAILESQAPESAQKNINLKILSELKVIVPEKRKQDQFASFVKLTDKSEFVKLVVIFCNNEDKGEHFMSTRKTIGGALGAIIVLIVAQILAQLVASLFVLVKIPEGICNIIAGIIYVGLAFVLSELFSKRLLKIKIENLGMPKFSIKAKWIIVGVLLPVTVKAVYLFFFSGKYVSSGMNSNQIFSTLSAGIAFTGIAAGFVEEMVFRGVILNLLKEKWNIKVAVLIPSVLFGLVHIIGMDFSIISSLLVLIAGTMVGIMFSMVAIESGSVWNSGIVHSLWNILIIGGGLSISEKADEYSVMTYVLDSKDFVFTGGEFGIESSIIALLGYVIVTLVAICMIKKKAKV